MSYKLVDEYYDWLMDIIKPNEQKPLYYDDVLKELFATEFYAVVENDENRVNDGLKMRDDFVYEKGYPDSFVAKLDRFLGPCSMLEMLISLAKRIEDEFLFDPKVGNRTKKWFWIMIKNLKLDVLAHPWPTFGPLLEGKSGPKNAFKDIVENFLERRYEKNGEGSIFRVNTGKIDMRKAEIWYQMCWFFDEKGDKI